VLTNLQKCDSRGRGHIQHYILSHPALPHGWTTSILLPPGLSSNSHVKISTQSGSWNG